jgi:hypothetical protein
MTSREKELMDILEGFMPFPLEVLLGYRKLGKVFTSGDLARICHITRSSAKYYIKKMLNFRMITKIPHKRRYQKYANAITFSDYIKDLIKLVLKPLENGKFKIEGELHLSVLESLGILNLEVYKDVESGGIGQSPTSHIEGWLIGSTRRVEV